MKLFSAEIASANGDEIAKAVIINKTRSGYELLNKYITEPENLKALSGDKPIYFAISYFDTIIESISVPPIKDSKTFKMLAKNKLRERLAEGEDYLVAYKPKESAVPDSGGGIDHTVYLIPSNIYTKSDVFTERQKMRTNIFTLADFALCGISAKVYPDDVVFHCFADENNIIINVSHGNSIIYTRAMDYNSSDDDIIDSVFYESINLTYMFVTKNLKVDVDRIILSGRMKDRPEFSKMLFDFNSKPQTVVMAGTFIKNCSREDFHEYMIPISLCMIDEGYDFTPSEYKEMRGFNILKMGINIALICLALVLCYMNLESFGTLRFANDRYKSEAKVIKLKLERNVNNFKNTDEHKYGFYYLNMLKKYSKSPFDVYGDVADVLDTGDYDKVFFQINEDGIPTVKVEGKLKFSSIKLVDKHKQVLENSIEEVSRRGFRIVNRSIYNMDMQEAEIKIVMEKVK